MAFANLSRLLANCEWLVFFDIEGTQFSHKAIAIGIVAVRKNPDSLTLDLDHPVTYHSYIHTDSSIGNYVEKLTGITADLLKEKGKSMHAVIEEINALLGKGKKKFISYGNNDINMINASIDHNNESEVNFYKLISKNYLDFHQYLAKRVINEKGQSYSVTGLMDLYQLPLPQEGQSHDPLFDSYCLAKIFNAYSSELDLDIELVLKNYQQNLALGKINSIIAKKVAAEGLATKEDLILLLKEYL